MKLTKLATKFTSKARERYNKTFDQSQSSSSGKFSTLSNDDFDIEDRSSTGCSSILSQQGSNHILRRDSVSSTSADLDSETYSIERIREEELNSVNSGTNASSDTSRYRKAYRSFKTAMKRGTPQHSSGATLNGGMFASLNTRLGKSQQPVLLEDQSKYYEEDSFDFNNNLDILAAAGPTNGRSGSGVDGASGTPGGRKASIKNDLLLVNSSSLTGRPSALIPDLITFQSDYSYDDKKEHPFSFK
jgi:hypothetical protein